ncbi:MAG: glycosyltransferase family 4 protein [Marinilabiliaceae bacterium]
MRENSESKKPVIAVIGLKGFPAYGGSARAGENMMAYLKDEFHFVVFNSKSHTTRKSGIYDGVQQIVFRKCFISSLNTLYYYLLATFYCLFRGGFDVVHVFHVDAAFIVPLLRLRYRVVSGHRARPQFADKWNPLVRHYFRFMEWLFFKMPADVVTSVNREVLEIFESRTRRHILYIPNGIDMANVRDLPAVEEKGYVLFASGRIIPAKGAHLMLEALREIGYEGKALVIGNRDHSPEYAQKLEEMAASLDVSFMDIIKNKKELMARVKNAGMFIFPSYHEGMSNMLLEAASLQVPLICSDIPGNRQVFNDDETFFFRSGDASDLAVNIRYVLDHPGEARKVARKGYERLEKEYNWEHLSRRYAGIYDWLIQNKKPLNRGDYFPVEGRL